MEPLSRVAYFGIVIGPEVDQPYELRTPEQLKEGIAPADLHMHHAVLQQLPDDVHVGSAVRYGEHSANFTSHPEYGALVKFLGCGWGELYVTAPDGRAKNIRSLRDGTWVYIPTGLQFCYYVIAGKIGDLTMQSVGVQRLS